MGINISVEEMAPAMPVRICMSLPMLRRHIFKMSKNAQLVAEEDFS